MVMALLALMILVVASTVLVVCAVVMAGKKKTPHVREIVAMEHRPSKEYTMRKEQQMKLNRKPLGICLVLALASVLGGLWSTAHAADQYVSGYYRSNGTYVQPYYRSAPNSSRFDNYSSQGNTNPYTGARGYQNPYSGYSSYSRPSYGQTYSHFGRSKYGY